MILSHTSSRARSIGFALLLLFCMCSCSLFEPREAEPPTQSGANYLPRTFPSNVILNLQTSITQKDPVGYIACFSDSSRTRVAYSFTPSEDAATVYGAVLRNWSYQQEQTYFQNLVAKRKTPNGFSRLELMPIDSIIGGSDTRSYTFNYSFVFEHTEPGFAQAATGTMIFTIINSNSEWTISNWVDRKRTNDLTWSSFKGKFSN